MATLNAIGYEYTTTYISEHELHHMEPFVEVAHELIHKKTGIGKDWLGWVDLPVRHENEEIQRIKRTADQIRNDSDALVVIGIGGSYLGARAVIEMLSHPFHNQLPKSKRAGPEIYFVGHHLSADYMQDLLELLAYKDVSVNVISKSGTTMEPAIAFYVFRDFMKKRYGPEANKRIYVTTDREKGILKKLADEEGYNTFIIPEDIGGRFSVLTPVGLLPIAAAGIDIDELMSGAEQAFYAYRCPQVFENNCYLYATLRNLFYRRGRGIELLVNYQPRLAFFSEWWKQLYGESEGKDGKGIFPATVSFTTDLHSMGQYIQAVPENLFETIVFVENSHGLISFQGELKDDGLDYLAGETLDGINSIAFRGTLKAHTDGGIPASILTLSELSPRACGEMIYFFQKACALSGYLSGVNPFDQPGVEVYKKNIVELLVKSKDGLHIY